MLDDVLLGLDILGAINAVLICEGVSLHLGTRKAKHITSGELVVTLDSQKGPQKATGPQDNAQEASTDPKDTDTLTAAPRSTVGIRATNTSSKDIAKAVGIRATSSSNKDTPTAAP